MYYLIKPALRLIIRSHPFRIFVLCSVKTGKLDLPDMDGSNVCPSIYKAELYYMITQIISMQINATCKTSST